MQGRVGAHHVERPALGDQEDVRNIATVFLVEMAALLGQIYRLARCDVLQIDDRISDPALRANDQAFKIRSLFGVGVADLAVFGNGEFRRAGDRSGPLDSARDRASVVYANDFVVLSKDCRGGGKEDCEKKIACDEPAHTPPLDARASAPQPIPPSMRFWPYSRSHCRASQLAG